MPQLGRWNEDADGMMDRWRVDLPKCEHGFKVHIHQFSPICFSARFFALGQ